MNKRICVIGGGRWGQNHIKTFYQMGCLAAIVDSNPERLQSYREKYPSVTLYDTDEAAIAQAYDGYTIATPAETHFGIASRLIQRGLNVLIEKPMTLSLSDAEKICEMAAKSASTVMVGHLLLFHPAIIKMKQMIDEGKIGKLYYLYSVRTNLGTVRTEENVFWSFAPHDISVFDYLIGQPALKIEGQGAKFLQSKIYDATLTEFVYPDNVRAHIFVSWLHPYKEQRMVVVGSKGMIGFDDVKKELRFYDKYVEMDHGCPVKKDIEEELIPFDTALPLTEELTYFVEHLGQKVERAGCRSGKEVVRILQTVQQLIDNDQ